MSHRRVAALGVLALAVGAACLALAWHQAPRARFAVDASSVLLGLASGLAFVGMGLCLLLLARGTPPIARRLLLAHHESLAAPPRSGWSISPGFPPRRRRSMRCSGCSPCPGSRRSARSSGRTAA